MEHFGAVRFCIFMTVVCQGVHGSSFMTTRLAELPETTPPPVINIITQVQQDIDCRYTDSVKQLTALKSKKFKSCYIVDEDPLWNPTDDDLQILVQNQKPQTIKDNDEFSKLRDKAGDFIAYMCRKTNIYWLITSDPPRPPPKEMNDKPPANSQKQETESDEHSPATKELTEVPKALEGTNNLVQFGQRAHAPAPQEIKEVPKGFDGTNNLVPFGQRVHVPGPQEIKEVPKDFDSGDNNMIEPPLQTGDRLQQHSMSIGDFLKPPPLPNAALLEPPPMQTGGFLEPPPLQDGGLLKPPQLGNGELLPPPLLNRNSDMVPEIKTPPPLAELLGLRRAAQKLENPPPLRPMLAKSRSLLRDSQQFDDQFPTPPGPDFLTPKLRFF